MFQIVHQLATLYVNESMLVVLKWLRRAKLPLAYVVFKGWVMCSLFNDNPVYVNSPDS